MRRFNVGDKVRQVGETEVGTILSKGREWIWSERVGGGSMRMVYYVHYARTVVCGVADEFELVRDVNSPEGR